VPPIAAECHIASLIPGVIWKGCYDGGGRVQRDWNRHEEREMVQDRLGLLASRPAETTPAPRGPFARRVQEYLQSTSPRAFASSVRGTLENLVWACAEDGSPQLRDHLNRWHRFWRSTPQRGVI
jgi:hypothetical protein